MKKTLQIQEGIMRLILAVLFVSYFTQQVSAMADICQTRESSLQFLLGQQSKIDGPVFKRGEWPALVNLGGWASSLGIIKKGYFEDRNLFTTVSIHNILAEIYMKHSRDARLLAPMQMAYQVLPEYQTRSGAYNFWPKVQGRTEDLHLPFYQLTNNTFAGTLAVPADADDTALAQLAHHYQYQLCLINGGGCMVPEQNVERYYTPYTDRGRFPAMSNISRGEIGTGAYMTWLFDESWFPNWFLALSPQSMGPRVVLDKNDVDCVVNANVVRTLTAYNRTNAFGYADACKLLRNNARDRDYNECGHYYPDTYWFHYSVARAYEDGATCLQEPTSYAIQHLLKKQRADGSWHNDAFNNDEILATAFALGALVKAGDRNNAVHVQALRKGLNYLMKRKETVYGQTYWAGGVFFSAGLPVRHHIQWYSHSFTTAVVMGLLYDAKNWLPEANCPSSF